MASSHAVQKLPARPHFYPHVMLPDTKWDRVIRALRDRGTKVDGGIADQIEESIQAMRQNRIDLDERKAKW